MYTHDLKSCLFRQRDHYSCQDSPLNKTQDVKSYIDQTKTDSDTTTSNSFRDISQKKTRNPEQVFQQIQALIELAKLEYVTNNIPIDKHPIIVQEAEKLTSECNKIIDKSARQDDFFTYITAAVAREQCLAMQDIKTDMIKVVQDSPYIQYKINQADTIANPAERLKILESLNLLHRFVAFTQDSRLNIINGLDSVDQTTLLQMQTTDELKLASDNYNRIKESSDYQDSLSQFSALSLTPITNHVEFSQDEAMERLESLLAMGKYFEAQELYNNIDTTTLKDQGLDFKTILQQSIINLSNVVNTLINQYSTTDNPSFLHQGINLIDKHLVNLNKHPLSSKKIIIHCGLLLYFPLVTNSSWKTNDNYIPQFIHFTKLASEKVFIQNDEIKNHVKEIQKIHKILNRSDSEHPYYSWNNNRIKELENLISNYIYKVSTQVL